MKRLFSTVAIAATILSAGCSKQDTDATAIAGSDKNGLKAHAVIENVSRTELIEGAESAQVAWQTNDFIGVVMKQAFENRLADIEATEGQIGYALPELFGIKSEFAGKTEADFFSDASETSLINMVETDDYYAIYPYSMVSMQPYSHGKTAYTLKLAEAQVADFAANFAANGAMVAKHENASYKNLSFEFKNVHAILKLSLTGDKKLDRIVFRGNDGETVAGQFAVDFAADDITKTQFAADGAKEIALACGVQLTAEPQTFRLIVPAGEYAKGYTVEFEAQDGEKLAKTVGNGAAKTIRRSTVYTLPTVDFVSQSTGGDASAEWLWQTSADLISDVTLDEAAGATDLGDAANCYMVNAAGTYKFKIAKGNGEAVTDALKDKYISFKASGAKGNAVIALKVNDRIAWSWHIWATDEVGTGAAAAGHTVMDRNLGATSTEIGDVASYGLYYQWGRKDPFIGANSVGLFIGKATDPAVAETKAFGTLTASYVGNAVSFATEQTSATMADCVAFSIANPMTFIISNAAINGGGTNSWFTSDYNGFSDLWGGVSNTKSAYDPCPAGYRIPEDANVTWAGYAKANFTFTELGATDNASGVTYPLAGYRDYNKGCIKNLGQWFFVPSSRMAEVSGNPKAQVLQITYTKTTDKGFLSNLVNPKFNTSANIANGYPIRCEKIK